MIEAILIPLGSALIMSLTQYVAKMRNGEEFEIKKLGRTMGAGIVAGIIAWVTGTEPSLADPASVGTVMATTGVLDVVSKLVWKLFKRD